jgi:hypothetical protein
MDRVVAQLLAEVDGVQGGGGGGAASEDLFFIGEQICFENQVYTVNIISIRTTNFGWACPNRVSSQAVFQIFAAGHPKFGVEREVRASPWVFALIASRLDAPRVSKKNRSLK